MTVYDTFFLTYSYHNKLTMRQFYSLDYFIIDYFLHYLSLCSKGVTGTRLELGQEGEAFTSGSKSKRVPNNSVIKIYYILTIFLKQKLRSRNIKNLNKDLKISTLSCWWTTICLTTG